MAPYADIRKPLCLSRSALAVWPPQRKQCRHSEAQQKEQRRPCERQGVAPLRKQRRRLGGGNDAFQLARFAARDVLTDDTVCVDNRADPGRGRTQHRQAFFQRTHPRLREMLVGPRERAEPCVVGELQQEIGALRRPQVLRKDRLVADERQRPPQPLASPSLTL